MICKICGKEYTNELYYINVCSDKCYDKNYWLERINKLDEFVIIDGICYHIDKNVFTVFKGFGGRRFTIKFIDGIHKGETVVTDNLWYNGKVPEEFRIKLKDNAIFYSEEEKNNCVTCRYYNTYFDCSQCYGFDEWERGELNEEI